MLEQYYRINEATGINLVIQPDGSSLINACTVDVEKDQLQFKTKKSSLKDSNELLKHFSPKIPVALNLSGKGVLIKQIEKTEAINQQNFSKVLPNADFADFYLQNFISGEFSFISLIRKTEADKWLNLLQGSGYHILQLSLGPFPVQHISQQTNYYEGDLLFDGIRIERLESGIWSKVNINPAYKSAFPVKVESENLDERLLIAYSAAFQLVLANKLELIIANAPSALSAYQAQIEDIKFKTNGMIVLVAAFVLLLVNFFVYSALSSATARLSNQVSRFSQSSDDLGKVNQHIATDEAQLKALGWEDGVDKSVLIDQVASLMPGDISLKEIAIDPVDVSRRTTGTNLLFTSRNMEITGVSEKIIPVNEWLERIRTKHWVKNIQLKSYVFSSDVNTGQFVLKIDY